LSQFKSRNMHQHTSSVQRCLSYCYPRIDPLDAANASFIDNGYPHTHMRPQLVRAVLLAHELQHRANVTFWLECGSMLGGSLIRTAQVARRLGRYDGLSLVASEWPALSNSARPACVPWAGPPACVPWTERSRRAAPCQSTRSRAM